MVETLAPVPGDVPLELAGITIDCLDPGPMATFYAAAMGGQISHEDVTGAQVAAGDVLILIRRDEDFIRPTWPSPDVPMQIHFEFYIDDLQKAQARLHQLGATTSDHQPHGDPGMLVMLDPAGHPFCIGTRPGRSAPV